MRVDISFLIVMRDLFAYVDLRLRTVNFLLCHGRATYATVPR